MCSNCDCFVINCTGLLYTQKIFFALWSQEAMKHCVAWRTTMLPEHVTCIFIIFYVTHPCGFAVFVDFTPDFSFFSSLKVSIVWIQFNARKHNHTSKSDIQLQISCFPSILQPNCAATLQFMSKGVIYRLIYKLFKDLKMCTFKSLGTAHTQLWSKRLSARLKILHAASRSHRRTLESPYCWWIINNKPW